MTMTVLALSCFTQGHHEHEKNKYSVGQYCNRDSMCPTWFVCSSQSSCQCGNVDSDGVLCDRHILTSAVSECTCVTYDNNTESTFAGSCFYNCKTHHSNRSTDLVSNILPKRPDMLLNNSACTRFHRTGLLCGECEDGHSPLVLSYNLSCVECPDGHKNWWKFILVAFVPLTFFYFIVVVFNINVTSSRLHGVVWISQTLSIPVLIRLVMASLSEGSLMKATKALIFFYSFWNLELFRSVLPDICLNVNTLQALALEYVIALYPFPLILTTYLIVKLNVGKSLGITKIWKPFHSLHIRLRKLSDVRTSIIDSFATFFFLSYTKIVSISADILIPTKIYQLGSNKSTYGLYYSPSVAYFGHDHLPYAILAIAIFTVFVCVPTALFFLYPFQFFQKFLSFFPINWYFLRVFVDAYQGGYKDGTQPGTFDCRWFSGVVILFSRPLMFIIYGTTLSMMFFVYATVLLTILLIATINIQPFKKIAVRYPSTDPIFLDLLILFYIAAIGRSVTVVYKIKNIHYAVMNVVLLSSACIPFVYIIFLIGFWLISRTRCIRVQ